MCVCSVKVDFFFVESIAILFQFILGNYGERNEKERNVKYVWSARL